MKPRGTLCKIGNYKFIKALYEEGCIYMNTLNTFWNIEDGGLRGDQNDGIHSIKKGTLGTASIKGGTSLPIRITDWTIEERPINPEKINIYSMYALRWDSGHIQVDTRNIEFGDSTLVITNANEFLKRLSIKLKAAKRRYKCDLISYVSDTYNGDIGLFKKTSKYSYQSEWRIACLGGDGKPLKLRLGSLKDISILVPTQELETCISLDFE